MATTNMTSKSVETRDLKVGDIMAFTGDTVIAGPTSGISTGRGKMDLIVKTKKGHIVQKSWNKHTLINVLQPSTI